MSVFVWVSVRVCKWCLHIARVCAIFFLHAKFNNIKLSLSMIKHISKCICVLCKENAVSHSKHFVQSKIVWWKLCHLVFAIHTYTLYALIHWKLLCRSMWYCIQFCCNHRSHFACIDKIKRSYLICLHLVGFTIESLAYMMLLQTCIWLKPLPPHLREIWSEKSLILSRRRFACGVVSVFIENFTAVKLLFRSQNK